MKWMFIIIFGYLNIFRAHSPKKKKIAENKEMAKHLFTNWLKSCAISSSSKDR